MMIKSSHTDQQKLGPKAQITQIILNILTLLLSICTSVN